uniref:Uncharacterized protein n=1 Tax=Trichogramma kaykai TaxID=54128 RepID=A0ABD2WZP0_9HYME
MNASLDRLITHMAMINERLDKVAQTQLEQGAAILQNSRTVAQLDERVSGEVNELRRRQNESSEMLSELQKRMTVFTSTVRDADVPSTCSTPTVDSCEVRVTGIPASVSTPDITTAECILKALQLERLNPHVISVRPWTAGRADPSNTSSATITAGVRTDACRGRAIVVRLASAIARETFLTAAPSLRTMKASSIFALHEDTANQLNLSPLLPPAQYRLLQKCWAIRKEKRILNPLIRDMRIYMRRSRDSQHQLISSEADLIQFYTSLSPATASNSSVDHLLLKTTTTMS